MRTILLATLIATTCMISAPAEHSETAANRFRGSDGSGRYTAKNLPVSWSDADYRWKIALPGTGNSSPLIWRNHLYLTCSEKVSTRPLLLCFNTDNGKQLWEKSFESGDHHLHRFNTFATSTPAVDEHHVYITWIDADHFRIAALNHDGREVWRRDLGTFNSQHGGGISPVVIGDKVIVANDNRGPSFIFALDRMSGKTRWKTDRHGDEESKTSYSMPLLYRTPEGKTQLIFISQANGMTAINPEDGSIEWQIMDLFPARTVMSPIQAGELILATCGAGGAGKFVVAVKPPTNAGEKPSRPYTIAKSAPYVCTPVVKNQHLFIVSDGGTATCFDALTGDEIWKDRLVDTYFSSPILVDDRIYVVSRNGEVVVFHAGDKFKLLGSTTLGEMTYATPVVDGGRLYLRTVSSLYCIE